MHFKNNLFLIQAVKIPKNVGDGYVDMFGKTWTFREEIGQNVQFEILRTNYGFTAIVEKKQTKNFRCKKNIHKKEEGCKFAGVYVKENGCLYTRGEHNHQ